MSVSGIDKGKDVLLGAILIDSGANNTIINAEIDLTPLEELEHRYIKISIPSFGIIPEGAQGGGNKAWTFIDEIIIE